MPRWWDELRNPELKCERVGHREVEVVERFYELPDPVKDIFHGRFVAIDVTKTVTSCARCGQISVFAVHEEVRRGINSLSMPGYRWDRLNRDGWIPQ